ncbi:MAG: hypothetical protein M1834_000515 [Cirrosporium novae-zelandiae]|nr:MAG: hypothetical protein M1834_000515 [Cirrosporium novae-zelandiae]
MSSSPSSSSIDGRSADEISAASSIDETLVENYSRILLITGAGQPNGIGQAVAREAVLKHKYAVVLGAHSRSSPKQLDQFVAELNKAAISSASASDTSSPISVAKWSKCDVTDWKSLQAFFSFAAAEFGGVDAVFCNAGIAAPYRKATFKQEHSPDYPTLDVNLTGALLTIEAALAFFTDHPRPNQVIVPTTSMCGFNPNPANPVYCASKAALIGATISFARRLELSGKPVRLAAIAPYYLRTNLCPQAFVDRIGENNLVPMEAVVGVVLDLISPESRKHGVIVKVEPIQVESDNQNSDNQHQVLIEDWIPTPVDFVS